MSDAEHDVTASESAARLTPAEIAYRDFRREADGLSESEVRAFLGRVADLVEAAREQELESRARISELEGRVREFEEGAPMGEAVEAFARLRQYQEAPPTRPEPRERRKPEEPAPEVDERLAGTGVDEPVEAVGEKPGEERVEVGGEEPDEEPEASADARALAERDALAESLSVDLVRSAKRMIQNEQNLLLDAARRARSRVEASRLLPEPLLQRDAWAALLASTIDAAYQGGRTSAGRKRRSVSAPVRVVTDLAAGVVTPLRERLTATIDGVVTEGPYASPAEFHWALAASIGARYREWRSHDLEVLLVDAIAAAHARGAYDGAPPGTRLRWVPGVTGRCPDCDDNALEPTVKGLPFPTGQPYPPAHPGCRCLVLPIEEDPAPSDSAPSDSATKI